MTRGGGQFGFNVFRERREFLKVVGWWTRGLCCKPHVTERVQGLRSVNHYLVDALVRGILVNQLGTRETAVSERSFSRANNGYPWWQTLQEVI